MKKRHVLILVFGIVIIFLLVINLQQVREEGASEKQSSKISESFNNQVDIDQKIENKTQISQSDMSTHDKARSNKLRNSSNSTNSVKKFMDKYTGGNWKVSNLPESSEKRIRNGEIKGLAKSKHMLTKFMSALVEASGENTGSLSEEIEEDTTRNIYTYRATQDYEGMQVYDGYIKVFVNKKTGSGFMVNSHVQNIPQDIPLTAKFTVDELMEKLRSQYESAGAIEKLYGPVVWALDASKAQVSYVFMVYLKKESLEIVIGAYDAQVLTVRSKHFH